MRHKPRYSIIPAGAVTDQSLEGRDLHVLCLLGCHTDKLGWCEASSQATLGAEINCSRSTFQRSIARLVRSGWVQTRAMFVSDGIRPYAPYAYRVVMDRDDPNILPFEHAVAAQMPEGGAHGRAPLPTGGQGVPIQDGQGCPHIRGQQDSGPSRDQENDSDSARARAGYSSDAEQIAAEIAEIAGVDESKHAQWFIAGPAVIVQRWIDAGYQRWQLIEGAKQVMLSRTSAPDDIRYFGKRWQRVRGESEAPAPIPTKGDNHETNRRSGKPRSAITAAIDGLIERLDGGGSSSGAAGEASPRLLSDRRRE